MASFSYCKCKKCQKVKANSENDIWIHTGTGNLSKDYFLSLEDGTHVKDFFTQPNLIRSSQEYNYWKPSSCIWFSNGSWLFDPYCDGSHADDIEDEMDDEFKDYKYRSVVIKSPKNILRISTLEDLNNFIEKYTGIGIRNKIMWEKISDDGYYGVAFNFRKVDHLTGDRSDRLKEKYKWHCSWDVESLCIFDIRAFDDVVVTDISFN